MAIDTQRKRQSVVAISHYASGPSIVPDGSFVQADRQTIGYGYYGIAVGGAPAVSPIDPIINRYYRMLMAGGTLGGTT